MTSVQLRQLRLKNRVKRSALARWTDIDASTLYRMETGRLQVPKYVELLYRYYIEQHRGQEEGGQQHATF